jgi:hypothetical protein
MQSVEITSTGNGATPKVVRHSAGNCASVNGTPSALPMAPAAPAATVPATHEAPEQAEKLIRVRDIHPIAAPRADQT